MSEQDVEIVRSAYDSFNKGDIPGALATYDENVQWTEPGGLRATTSAWQLGDSL